MITTIVSLHYYGKHLDLRDKSKMGEFIKEYTEANDYATS